MIVNLFILNAALIGNIFEKLLYEKIIRHSNDSSNLVTVGDIIVAMAQNVGDKIIHTQRQSKTLVYKDSQ